MRIKNSSATLLRQTLVVTACAIGGPSWSAQAGNVAPLGSVVPQTTTVANWLVQLHDAAMQNRAYVGTFVVTTGNSMSSARIWHVCQGSQQMERIENLTGEPRTTFRHNGDVITFLPHSRVAYLAKSQSIGLFPQVLQSAAGSIGDYYQAQPGADDRVAGVDTTMMQLEPKDPWRFGYRVWTEKKTGLVVKLQTLNESGKVIEQAAFSELELNAQVNFNRLSQMMAQTKGYAVENSAPEKTTAQQEGWSMRSVVPGFKSVDCYKRAMRKVHNTEPPGDATLQWIFTDGLATVSLFLEPMVSPNDLHEGVTAEGATHTLTRKLQLPGMRNPAWLTVVGEVPVATLNAFANGLERIH